jgi:hypothetical protein
VSSWRSFIIWENAVGFLSTGFSFFLKSMNNNMIFAANITAKETTNHLLRAICVMVVRR